MQRLSNRGVCSDLLGGKLELDLHLLPHLLFLSASDCILLPLLHALAEIWLDNCRLLLSLDGERINLLLQSCISLCDGIIKKLLHILRSLDGLFDIVADSDDLIEGL